MLFIFFIKVAECRNKRFAVMKGLSRKRFFLHVFCLSAIDNFLIFDIIYLLVTQRTPFSYTYYIKVIKWLNWIIS